MCTRLTAQLEVTYQLTKPLDLAVQCRSLYQHSAEEEVRHAGKSYMGTDPLEPKYDLCRAENPMHATEVCEHAIIFGYNNLICP